MSEGKPLKELNVKPGDIVECVGWSGDDSTFCVGELYTIYRENLVGICDSLCAVRKGGFQPVESKFSDEMLFKIVGRAKDVEQKDKPMERKFKVGDKVVCTTPTIVSEALCGVIGVVSRLELPEKDGEQVFSIDYGEYTQTAYANQDGVVMAEETKMNKYITAQETTYEIPTEDLEDLVAQFLGFEDKKGLSFDWNSYGVVEVVRLSKGEQLTKGDN